MVKKIKRKKKGSNSLKHGNLSDMLKKVFLGGIVEECILDINKGVGSITAVDITNSIIVMVKNKITGKKTSGEFGLGNIDLLIKFLSTVDDTDIPFKITRNKLNIHRKDGQRKLNYILTQPDLIATRFQQEEDTDPYEEISGLMEYKVDLSDSLMKDFLKYISMLKTKSTTIKFDGEDVSIICGTSDDYKMELKPDTDVEVINEDDSDGFSVKVDGDYLSRILSVIEVDEDEPPVMLFAEDKPVMIEEKGNVWVLVPLTDLEEEEEEEE